MRQKTKGFTIVELLVVLAISAMLLAIVFTLFADSKKNARDSKREQDMKELQNALNIFVVNSQFYPVCGVLNDINDPESEVNDYVAINGVNDCLSQSLIEGEAANSVVPDPLGGGNCGESGAHVYCYASDGFNYVLRYSLETDNIQGKEQGWQNIVIKH